MEMKSADIKTYTHLKENLLRVYKEKLELLTKSEVNVYIFGAGDYGKKVLNICRENNIYPKGFIDNNYGENPLPIEGLEVYKPQEIENTNDLIIISSLFSSYNIFQKLEQKGFNNLIPFLILFVKYDKYLDERAFLNETLEEYMLDVVCNRHEYFKTMSLFEDEKSKKILQQLMDLRLNYNYSTKMQEISPYKNMYFDKEIFTLENNEIFIDGGGFTGDTSLDFIKQTNEVYKKIFLFEPCMENFEKAKYNLRAFENINFYQKGIDKFNRIIGFETNLNKVGCHISETGNETVETVAIDAIIDEPVTMIKFDIEGYEKKGLLGAKKLIEKYAPKLAICSYHRPSDLWEIPQIIKQICPEYKLYLRIYGGNPDSVVYAIK
ncbi:MAG TPA: FkbM family methyltransferase [Candidatus Gastranaerophilales bacterium]|nr:FkbM family methyltransferase [Candidatus Gastranaerophilales bacterium]